MNIEEITRKEVVSQLLKAIGGIVGGIILLLLNLVNGVFFSLIIGLILLFIGAVAVYSVTERAAGIVSLVAGGAIFLSIIPALSSITFVILLLGGILLIVAGLYSAFRFFVGFRSLNRA